MQKIGWKLEREEAIAAMKIPFASVVSQGGWNLSFNSDKGESAYLQIDEGGILQDRMIMIVAEYSSRLEVGEKSEALPESVQRLIPEITQFPDSSRISQSQGAGGMLMEEYSIPGNKVFEVLEFYHDKIKNWDILQENVKPRKVSLTVQKEDKNETQMLMIFIDLQDT